MSLSPRQRWLSRSRIQILIHSLVSQLLVISLISHSHVPVVFQKHQISPEFCWIWFLFGVRYPWTTWLSLFLSIACIPLISIACFYTSSNICPFLKLSAIFLPELGHRPSCLNTSMFSSHLVVIQLLSFLRWTHDARDLWPRAVDPLFSSSRYTQKLSESSSSLLILSPALLDPCLSQKWLPAAYEIKVMFLEDFWKTHIISICYINVLVSSHSLISSHLSFSLVQ